jgi:GDSL-like Lipase/Acylhydrolase
VQDFTARYSARKRAAATGLIALRPTQAGGLNFAVGGARLDPLSGPHSLRAQADLFLRMCQPSGRTLHIVYGGGNDLLSAVGHLKAPRMVETAVASLRSIVADLVSHGASDLLVPNLPDVGMTPKIRARARRLAHAAVQRGCRPCPLGTCRLLRHRETLSSRCPSHGSAGADQSRGFRLRGYHEAVQQVTWM